MMDSSLDADTALSLQLFYHFFGGILISLILYGVTILQGWIYLMNNDDRWPLRTLVGFLILADSATAVLDIQLLYHYFVGNYGNPTAFLSYNWCFPLEFAFINVITLLVQLFLASRVYLMIKVSVPSIIISVTAVGSFVAGIIFVIDTASHTLLEHLFAKSMQIEIIFFSGLAIISDTIAMFYMLKALRTSRATVTKRLKAVLQKLLLYLVTRGVLVSIIQILNIVLYLAQTHTLDYAAIHFCTGRIYVITLVSILNTRNGLRDDLYSSEDDLASGLRFGEFSANSASTETANNTEGTETTKTVEEV